MSYHLTDDTIVSRATPPGSGAVAIVRVSGPQALAIAQKMAPGTREARRLVRVAITDGEGAVLDDGMVSEMVAPNSYTGEDVVEFFLHGSPDLVASVLRAATRLGARQAMPGEFTYRAWAHGKLDLVQAEAVADLIDTEDARARAEAQRRLGGQFSAALQPIYFALRDLVAEWEAALDFPEQESGAVLDARRDVVRVQETLADLSRRVSVVPEQTARAVVLAGAPNVGKSTLINQLLGQERVLVDEQAGTTRDAVEITLQIDGSAVRLWDTAGLRSTEDRMEQRGQDLTLKTLADADRVFWLVDVTSPEWPTLSGDGWIAWGSKADLAGPDQEATLRDVAQSKGLGWGGMLSGQTGAGVNALRDALAQGADWGEGISWWVKERHVDGLRLATRTIETVLSNWEHGTADMQLIEMREALSALGQILGKDVDGEMIDTIFGRFCLGK